MLPEVVFEMPEYPENYECTQKITVIPRTCWSFEHIYFLTGKTPWNLGPAESRGQHLACSLALDRHVFFPLGLWRSAAAGTLRCPGMPLWSQCTRPPGLGDGHVPSLAPVSLSVSYLVCSYMPQLWPGSAPFVWVCTSSVLAVLHIHPLGLWCQPLSARL